MIRMCNLRMSLPKVVFVLGGPGAGKGKLDMGGLWELTTDGTAVTEVI